TFIITTLMTVFMLSVGRSLPAVIHFIVIAPHLAIENCMNGYLFRHVREAAERARLGTSIDTTSMAFTTHFSSHCEDDEMETANGTTSDPTLAPQLPSVAHMDR
ncbi:hypothetical protein V5O48_011445, partial [Marasmius crinis-equi]